jgi:hypothetical protein
MRPAAEKPPPLSWADADRARIGPAPGDPGWMKPSPARRRWMAVAWPSFLLAAVIEVLVFAFVDPAELRVVAEELMTRELFYTAAFFAFWSLVATACWFTALLLPVPQEP